MGLKTSSANLSLCAPPKTNDFDKKAESDPTLGSFFP
jgi:hypothetical protein